MRKRVYLVLFAIFLFAPGCSGGNGDANGDNSAASSSQNGGEQSAADAAESRTSTETDTTSTSTDPSADVQGSDGGSTASGECSENATSLAGKLMIDGVEFSLDKATVNLAHRIDMDPSLDGCITEVTLTFSKGADCLLNLSAGGSLDIDDYMAVQTVTMELGEGCSGIDSASYGTYVAADLLQPLSVLLQPTHVAAEVASLTCHEASFSAVLNGKLERDDGIKIDVSGTQVTAFGAFPSSGSSAGACPSSVEEQQEEPVNTEPPNPEICSGHDTGELQSFGGSCCYTSSTHPTNPNCVWYTDEYDGSCLDAQCKDNFCTSARYCTIGCVFYDDTYDNATGEAYEDGVVDDIQPDDCKNSFPADGPYGTEFRCVNIKKPTQDPTGICRPGITFGKCTSTDDCQDGETCSILYVLGEYEGRCMTTIKNGASLGEPCNSDPNAGPIVSCEGPLCYSSFGCSEFCTTDDHCATDSCVGGVCEKDSSMACESDGDCSALYCRGGIKPYSSSDYEDEFCWPRACERVGDCKDPDWFCRPYWNGADTVEEVEFAPACRPTEEGLAKYGEPCGGDNPSCVYSSGCIHGICSGPCKSDADCQDGAECLMGDEWNIDVNDDEATDLHMPLDLCVVWEHDGELQDCLSDDDCAEGHHCQYRVKGSGEGEERQWEIEYKCRKSPEGIGSFGDICGGDTGVSCGSTLCLIPTSDSEIPGMCAEYCKSKTDCPDTVNWNDGTYKTYCKSYQVTSGDSTEEIDDGYVSYCWRTPSFASVEPCTANKQCDSATEFCRASPIAGAADEPVIVEHYCLDASEGLDTVPVKEVGAPCTSWTECRGRSCLSDGGGGKYCSALCGSDSDCENFWTADLRCTDETLIPRLNPEHSGVTQRCRLAKTCLACDDDESCGGDFVCINMGTSANPYMPRCGAPCTEGDDCEDPTHSCREELAPTGESTGKFACVPDICPDDT